MTCLVHSLVLCVYKIIKNGHVGINWRPGEMMRVVDSRAHSPDPH